MTSLFNKFKLLLFLEFVITLNSNQKLIRPLSKNNFVIHGTINYSKNKEQKNNKNSSKN